MSILEETVHSPGKNTDTVAETFKPEELYVDPEKNSDAVGSGLPTAADTSKPEELSVDHSWRVRRQALRSEILRVFTILVLLFALFWGFAIATARHPIAISSQRAEDLLWSIPKIVGIVFTPVSTCLTIFVVSLYARCLQIAARRRLTKPLDIQTLLGWSAIISHRRFGLPVGAGSHWAKLALLSWILVWSLTTGFNTFLFPQKFPVSRNLPSLSELDMSSAAFLNEVYTPMSQNLPCRYGNYSFFSCSGLRQPFFLLDAGESAAFVDLGFATLTSFATASFFGTSGGVMPIGAYPNSIWFAESSADPSGTNMKSSPTTVIYAQQGLTANVTCTMEQSSPLTYTINQTLSSSTYLISPTINCSGNVTSLPQQLVGSDFALAASCSSPNQTQYIYLQGVGAYQTDPEDGSPVIANMTCQLDPIFTTNALTALFDSLQGNNILYVTSNASEPALPNSNTTLIRDIAATLTQSILEGQSVNGNIFVDTVQGIARQNLISPSPGSEYPTNLIVQSMFRGMFEISGLAINGYWSSKLFTNDTAAQFLTSPYTREIQGNLTFSVYGWNNDTPTIIGLFPFTVLTIVALVLLIQCWRDRSYISSRFDPSNPAHLIVASASGDFSALSETLKPENLQGIEEK